MTLADALRAVPRHLIDNPDAIPRGDMRGRHNGHKKGDQNANSILTSKRVSELRSLRADNPGVSLRELHAKYCPDISIHTFRGIFKSNSQW